MEDFQLDLLVGKGPTARSIRLDLPRFTLIGATTGPVCSRARFATGSASWRDSTSTAPTTFRRSSPVRRGSSGSRSTRAGARRIAERSTGDSPDRQPPAQTGPGLTSRSEPRGS